MYVWPCELGEIVLGDSERPWHVRTLSGVRLRWLSDVLLMEF